ncbi:unnamed protein product [Polarella glacialis]|uniref:Predicted 3'-5' exonuclease PolB-like domain-containing protein n=1 Tax=Polarella glacialis TaxID=89957 RepID=A0A813DW22_POLGL|nr:unnamed protein product [Polarella glacialis]CAE8654344.1 unnamed protein product [Polarella glacialis]
MPGLLKRLAAAAQGGVRSASETLLARRLGPSSRPESTTELVFDLETIPDVVGLRKLHSWAAGMSDSEVAKRAGALRREVTGSDFMPLHLHRVVVIGCALRNRQGFQILSLGSPGDPEEVLLKELFEIIESVSPRLISWNGSGFDLPVLHYRCLVHGISAPRYWDMREDNNYISRFQTRHLDLMDVLAKYNGRANAPLSDIAKLCAFPGKMGMDGSNVQTAWQGGGVSEVRAYCETDVANTWLLYCRFRLIQGELSQAAYLAELALVRETLAATGAAHWKEYLAAWDSAEALSADSELTS